MKYSPTHSEIFDFRNCLFNYAPAILLLAKNLKCDVCAFKDYQYKVIQTLFHLANCFNIPHKTAKCDIKLFIKTLTVSCF